MTEQSLICDLSVFTDEERQQHMAEAQQLFAKVIALQETNTGYSLQFANTGSIIIEMATFINADRRCCRFIHFGIEVKPNSTGIYLLLSGDNDVKKAIKSELLSLLPAHLTQL